VAFYVVYGLILAQGPITLMLRGLNFPSSFGYLLGTTP
jgi:hypothetical protein